MYIKNTKRKNNCAGFTLIELAIYIIIFGTILLMYLNLYKVWQESKIHYIAENNINNAVEAVENFRLLVQRYPCPANPAIAVGAPGYGEEDCSLAPVAGNNAFIAPAPNVLVGNLPLVGFDNSNGTPSANPDVRIPLRSLLERTRIESKDLEDPWNETFRYAVTNNLTDDSLFDGEGGSIKIEDEFGRDTGGTTGDAHFVIYSRGDDNDCVARGAAEAENCDGDSVFRVGLSELSPASPNYYDDYVRFKRSYDADMWVPTRSVNMDLYPLIGPTGKLYIGDYGNYEANPLIGNIKLDVDGDVLVEDSVSVPLICNGDETECLDPMTFYAEFWCPTPGEYPTRVNIDPNGQINRADFQAGCETPTFSASNFGYGCPAGTYLRFLYTDNTPPICQSP